MKKIKKIIIGILILIVAGIVLASGALSFRTYQQVKHVNSYHDQVETIAKKYQVAQYTDVLLGIVMTESKGRGADLMQSSESAYGDQGKITTKEESIESGVKHFAETYEAAKNAGCDLATAVQAYNFGLQYIEYVKQHGGKNSVELAETYSRDILSPTLGNHQKDKYRYLKVQSVMYNGGYLYKNGGNMFYASVVCFNERLIKEYQKFTEN